MVLNFGYGLVKGFRGGNFAFIRTNAVFFTISGGQMTKINRNKK